MGPNLMCNGDKIILWGYTYDASFAFVFLVTFFFSILDFLLTTFEVQVETTILCVLYCVLLSK